MSRNRCTISFWSSVRSSRVAASRARITSSRGRRGMQFHLYAKPAEPATEISNRNLGCAPKKKRPGVSSGPLRLSSVSYRCSSSRCLVHRSWSGRPFLTNGSSRYGPNLLVKLAERNFQCLFRRMHEVNLHSFEHLRLQIFLHVRLVLRGEYYLPDSRSLRAEHLFLDSAHRQHDSGQ